MPFASIIISEVIDALTDLNIPALLQVALLAELEQLSAEATVADAPASNIFEFTKGGREGGVDTPSLWFYFFQWLLEPVVAQWEIEGLGFRLSNKLVNESTYIISHIIWVDHIFLVASSWRQVSRMFLDISKRLHSIIGCGWKPESLHVLANQWAKQGEPELRRASIELELHSHELDKRKEDSNNNPRPPQMRKIF